MSLVKVCPNCNSKRLDKIYRYDDNNESIYDQCLDCGCDGIFGVRFEE